MEKRLCSLRDQFVAGMIEDILSQNGIHPRPLSTSEHVFVAGAGQWYDLWVPEDEEENARKVLTALGYQTALVSK